MGIQGIKDWARVLARAGVPAFIVGPHGIGKTSAIYQLYREAASEAGQRAVGLKSIHKVMTNSTARIDAGALSSIDGRTLSREDRSLDDFGFWSVSAANITAEELIGMPDVEDRDAIYRQVYLETLQAASRMAALPRDLPVVHGPIFQAACEDLGVNESDKGRRVLRYLRMNALLPDPDHRGGGMWCIDEMNLGFVEVEKALMQILLEGRYLDYILPDNVWVVTTMNPPSPEYPGARELSLPTVDRGAMITVSSDKDEWLTWAARRGLSESSRMFVEKHDKLLNPVEAHLRLSEMTNPGTYRSVEWVDRAFAVMTDDERAKVGLAIAISLLGPDAGAVYYRETKENTVRPLSVAEVVDGYGWRASMSDEEERDHESWKVTKSRSKLLAMVKKANVKTELVAHTLVDLGLWVSDMADELRGRDRSVKDQGQILNMLLFLNDLPADISRNFLTNKIAEDLDTLLAWTRGYPVVVSFLDRIENDYKDGGGNEA